MNWLRRLQMPSKTVLIVEDERPIAMLLSKIVEQLGLSPVVAYNGEDGLARAREVKPDMVLLDLIMPIMSGECMLEKMQEDDSLADIPVVITSTTDDEDDLWRGQYPLLRKPFEPAQVRELVRTALGL
jgi:twitching motility two-component system response regulator PilH